MKIKFVLKAKDLNKKWLKSVKSLYGKQKLVISIEPDKGQEMDYDFDDDSWWDDEEEEFALEVDNTIDAEFNAEEYLASIEKQLAEEEEKSRQSEKSTKGKTRDKKENTLAAEKNTESPKRKSVKKASNTDTTQTPTKEKRKYVRKTAEATTLNAPE